MGHGVNAYRANYQSGSKNVFTKMSKTGHFLVFWKVGGVDNQVITSDSV